MLHVLEAARLADVPQGWVENILEGQALHRLDPLGRYALDVENGMIFVPVTFGQVEATLD